MGKEAGVTDTSMDRKLSLAARVTDTSIGRKFSLAAGVGEVVVSNSIGGWKQGSRSGSNDVSLPSHVMHLFLICM